ncbi:MAG: hypothetical protein CM15mP120_17020 [Pseudomonadota bacterium]|nr:MAG: hypothetical protein CM15mP120_17020 [Pseudomonadota bacterium]
MDLAELEQRLLPFCQARYEGSVTITEVITMPVMRASRMASKWPTSTARTLGLSAYRRQM